MNRKCFFYFLTIFVLLICLNVSGQIITTYAGNGGTGATLNNVPATSTTAYLPHDGSFDAAGNYYFASSQNRIRKITPSGIITTVAGTGIGGYSGDNGPATAAQIHCQGMHVDSIGNIYIADYYNYRVRKVDIATGIIHLIAGTGASTASSGNGGAATAAIMTPQDVVTDNSGNIYVSDGYYANPTIRKIDLSGNINFVCNGGGYIAFDTDCHHLFMVLATHILRLTIATSIVDTIAGTGLGTYNGDEIPATAANFNASDIAVSDSGYIFIADHVNDRVRKIDGAGIIHTVAGTGIEGYNADNIPATAAQVYNPQGLAFDECGNLYIADDNNHRVRRIIYPRVPTLSINGPATAAIGSTVTLTATTGNTGHSYTINWYNHGTLFTTTTVPTVSYTKTAAKDSITATIYGCSDSATSSFVIVWDSHLGIGSAATGSITVYPQPITNTLHIDGITGAAAYTLYTVTGKVAAMGVLQSGGNTLPLSELPAGVYVLQLTDERERSVWRVVKK